MFLIIIISTLCFLIIMDSGWSEISASKSPQDSSAMIGSLYPANRIVINDRQWQITQEPIYFTTRMPAPATRVELELVYDNTCCQSIKAGLQQQSNNQWAYQLQSVNNKHFDDLNWSSISDGQYTLWQKQENYSSIADFMTDLDQLEKVAAYNVDFDQDFVIANYQDAKESKDNQLIIRGEYSFYTYVDQQLAIEFEFQDLNRANNEDNIVISVFDLQNHKIYEHSYRDDGYVLDTDPESEPKDINLQIDDLVSGAYRVVVSVSNDIFTTRLTTKQQYLTFINKLYLADSSEYADGLQQITGQPSRLLTNSSEIRFSTSHRAGLQSIVVNDQQIAIEQLHQYYTITDFAAQKTIDIPQNDILVEGNGLFAFSKAMYFDPQSVKKEVIYSEDNYDYFIAKYQKPQQEDGQLVSKVSWPLAGAQIERGQLRFIISAPGVRNESPLQISSIKIKYYPEQTDSIIEHLINYFRYWYVNRR
ncbi:MAG: hypothetical protein ABH884_01365 [Candidatus Komeilibacteria bacterium]